VLQRGTLGWGRDDVEHTLGQGHRHLGVEADRGEAGAMPPHARALSGRDRTGPARRVADAADDSGGPEGRADGVGQDRVVRRLGPDLAQGGSCALASRGELGHAFREGTGDKGCFSRVQGGGVGSHGRHPPPDPPRRRERERFACGTTWRHDLNVAAVDSRG